MKKVAALICFILLFSLGWGLQFRPNSVKEIDVNLTLRASGSFAGAVHRGDELKLKMLTLGGFPNQQILSIDEKLLIGEDEIKPAYEFGEGDKYAVFEVKDLYEYRKSNLFEIIINARVKTSALMLLGDDYNLVIPIEEKAEFLSETDYIEVNDSALRSKALLEFTSDSGLETIRGIAEWVNRNVEYDRNYYLGRWSARQTYNNRKGVCDEFANLTAAFTRIRGIPAKYVTGISFDGERFGNHGWLEVFLPSTGWVGLDSTYGEVGYLDAAHIALAKSADSNDIVNVTTTTITRGESPPTVQTTLHDPVVEINSVKFFADLVAIDLNKPKKLGLNQRFEISAVVENKQNSNIIIPLKLSLHEDFSVEKERVLLWLKPLERKIVVWNGVAPSYVPPKTYAKYEMLFLSPDKNIADIIEVHEKIIEREPESVIRIADVSPYIEGNDLRIEISLSNEGTLQGEALIELFHLGKKIYSEKPVIPAETEKKIVYYVNNIGPGKVFLKIEADESKNYEVVIPEENGGQEKLGVKEVEEITIEEEEGPLEGVNLDKFVEEYLDWIIIGAVAIAIIFALILFIIPGMKR